MNEQKDQHNTPGVTGQPAMGQPQIPGVAKRMQFIEPFHVMALLARAKELEEQGRSIIHMEIGEPDFVTPDAIMAQAQQGLSRGLTHYTAAVGTTELREAIANHYQTKFATQIPRQHIVITPGASGALMLILGVLINPGDQVLMADPGYPCNRHFVRLMEGDPVGIPVDASVQYQLTAERVREYWNDKTRVVMLASPANPTGTVIPEDELKDIIEFVASKQGYVIVDEIYHELIYDRQIPTAAGIRDCVFVINSFSKYYQMTGWRLGWLVSPEPIVKLIDKLAQNIFLAPPTISQYAALAAFHPETLSLLEERKTILQERRDFLLPALRELGFDIPVAPQGAFYIYANCAKMTEDSFAFSQNLLEHAGVAVTPGIDFGHHLPQQHVRFAYTTSIENLERGVSRIRQFLENQ